MHTLNTQKEQRALLLYEAQNTGMGPLLAPQEAFWDHWGFTPWQHGVFAGVARGQRFVKDGILGAVAEYWAWDCIAWDIGTPEEREALWASLTPLPEVMTQRFVFLTAPTSLKRRIRSFSWGFRGYGEFYTYWPDDANNAQAKLPRDLTDLVEMALRLHIQTIMPTT